MSTCLGCGHEQISIGCKTSLRDSKSTFEEIVDDMDQLYEWRQLCSHCFISDFVSCPMKPYSFGTSEDCETARFGQVSE